MSDVDVPPQCTSEGPKDDGIDKEAGEVSDDGEAHSPTSSARGAAKKSDRFFAKTRSVLEDSPPPRKRNKSLSKYASLGWGDLSRPRASGGREAAPSPPLPPPQSPPHPRPQPHSFTHSAPVLYKKTNIETMNPKEMEKEIARLLTFSAPKLAQVDVDELISVMRCAIRMDFLVAKLKSSRVQLLKEMKKMKEAEEEGLDKLVEEFGRPHEGELTSSAENMLHDLRRIVERTKLRREMEESLEGRANPSSGPPPSLLQPVAHTSHPYAVPVVGASFNPSVPPPPMAPSLPPPPPVHISFPGMPPSTSTLAPPDFSVPPPNLNVPPPTHRPPPPTDLPDLSQPPPLHLPPPTVPPPSVALPPPLNPIPSQPPPSHLVKLTILDPEEEKPAPESQGSAETKPLPLNATVLPPPSLREPPPQVGGGPSGVDRAPPQQTQQPPPALPPTAPPPPSSTPQGTSLFAHLTSVLSKGVPLAAQGKNAEWSKGEGGDSRVMYTNPPPALPFHNQQPSSSRAAFSSPSRSDPSLHTSSPVPTPLFKRHLPSSPQPLIKDLEKK